MPVTQHHLLHLLVFRQNYCICKGNPTPIYMKEILYLYTQGALCSITTSKTDQEHLLLSIDIMSLWKLSGLLISMLITETTAGLELVTLCLITVDLALCVLQHNYNHR